MADETGSQNTPQGGTQPPSIDYGKIEDMIHKGTQQRESAILEGYFKQLGMSGEELQTAVQDFKTKRTTQAKEKETSYQNAQQEITRLKAQVLENDIRSKASDIAADLGVDRKSLPYLLRMADLTSAADSKGVISDENIKKALEKVLTDVPALKGSTQQNSGFMQIGGSGGSNDPTAAQNEMLSNIFGTNRKKGRN